MEIRELAQSVGDRGCTIVANPPHKLAYYGTLVMESDDEEEEHHCNKYFLQTFLCIRKTRKNPTFIGENAVASLADLDRSLSMKN